MTEHPTGRRWPTPRVTVVGWTDPADAPEDQPDPADPGERATVDQVVSARRPEERHPGLRR